MFLVEDFDVENVEYDLLGARNGVRAIIEDVVTQLADSGTGFTFGKKVHPKQVNLLKLRGYDTDEFNLGGYLQNIYQDSGPYLSSAKYFLRNYLCYVEIPTFRFEKGSGEKKASYDKFLATSCLEIASAWASLDEETAESKYAKHLSGFDSLESDESLVPILKLGRNKMGRSITKPRSPLDLGKAGIRVVPVFALRAYVTRFYKKAKNELARVTFIKDNGSERVIDTTFSEKVLSDLYQDSSFVSTMLESCYDGNFLGSTVIDRGYIRVPEVGASIYDGSGVRAVSYTRIGSIEYGVEPNMEFAKVDLEGVVFAFSGYTNKLKDKQISSLVTALGMEGFDVDTLTGKDKGLELQVDAFQLETWADLQNRVLSTTFQRSLALFMKTNPLWFGGYTGERGGLSSDITFGSSSDAVLQDLDDLI